MEIVVLMAAIVGLVTALVNLTVTLLGIGKEKTIAPPSDSLLMLKAREFNSLAYSIFYIKNNAFIRKSQDSWYES